MHMSGERSSDAEIRRQQAQLIAALSEPSLYPHPVAAVEHLETHISHLMLAGEFVYKIKKPVDLGFLNFKDLDARRHYCEEELRLNRRTASAIYMKVIPIAGRADNPVLGGTGPPIEYAVKMRRFPQSALFSAMLDRNALEAQHIDALAIHIVELHGKAAAAKAGSPFGEPRWIEETALQNFEQLDPLLEDESDKRILERLRIDTERAHAQLREVFGLRKREGFVRECHGDLHLENIVWYHGDAMPFDCIEFNDGLRWIDVMNEVAFVVMDLCVRSGPKFGFRLLNEYLEQTGDYGGLAALPYYMIYRALVRAKVLTLRTPQTSNASTAEKSRMRSYLAFAQRFASNLGSGAIIITHGVSGAGKSTLTQHLLEELGAIRARSDVERKRLVGLPFTAHSGAKLGQGVYASQVTLDTYSGLERFARVIAKAGYMAIIDATFLRRDQRKRFRCLAEELGLPFVILDCQAQEAVLRARITERERRGGDPSEADLTVLEHQLTTREPLNSGEQASAIVFDAERGNWHQTAHLLKTRLSHA